MTLHKVSQNGSSNEVASPRKISRPPLFLGQGRLRERVPVAVIDIGSNSVRQVIYEGLTRAPAVLFNEKVLCGLGQGLVSSGELNPRAVERALAAVKRFTALQHQAHVGEVHILATAAARDANNGPAFIEEVERISGQTVEVLSGALEAHYSALGIRSGFFRPWGIVGDMGGGSLELIGINGTVSNGITLPLGGLRLRELANNSLDEADKIARKHVRHAEVEWPQQNELYKPHQKTFFAVGGTWRSLGKLHIANRHYPLPAVHDYEIDAAEMERFCIRIADGKISNIKGLDAVSKNRRDLLPYGAIVLREVIRRFKPDTVAISSLGVREGFLYSRLSAKEQAKDSLLEATRDLSVLRARSPEHSLELDAWTEKAFAVLGIQETENEKRYRKAACNLADIGWRAHPDFRAQQALEIIANAGFVGINHEGRAYISLANYHRYQGLGSKTVSPPIAVLAPPELQKKARILAGMFRVLYLFSASMPGVIPRIGIHKKPDGGLLITLPSDVAELQGERPEERISQLGKELDCEITLQIED